MAIQLLSIIVLSYIIHTNCMQDFLPTKVSRSFHAEQIKQLEEKEFERMLNIFERKSNPYMHQAFKEIVGKTALDNESYVAIKTRRPRTCTVRSGNKLALALQAVPRSMDAIEFPDAHSISPSISLMNQVMSFAPPKIHKVVDEWNNRRKSSTVPTKVLFITGPTGTGKSTLVESIAYKCQMPCFKYYGHSLSDCYQDSGEINLVRIFEHAALNAPCVLAIDNIDSILENRHHDQNNEMFLRLCRLISAYKDHPILFIGVSINDRPEFFELTESLNKDIFPIPNRYLRIKIFKDLLQKLDSTARPLNTSKINFYDLAEATDEYSYQLIFQVALYAAKRAKERSKTAGINLCMHDFYDAIIKVDEICEDYFRLKPRPTKKARFFMESFTRNLKTQCGCK